MSNENPFKRVEMTLGTWIVVCLGRPLPDDELPANFDWGADDGRAPSLATRSGFATREDAARYAATINPAWRPALAMVEAV